MTDSKKTELKSKKTELKSKKKVNHMIDISLRALNVASSIIRLVKSLRK